MGVFHYLRYLMVTTKLQGAAVAEVTTLSHAYGVLQVCTPASSAPCTWGHCLSQVALCCHGFKVQEFLVVWSQPWCAASWSVCWCVHNTSPYTPPQGI
jgi:hypothetical protein